jgi:hypothetical protein
VGCLVRVAQFTAYMNLSHYQLVDPHVHYGDREKRVEADYETFTADHQAAVLPLEPRTCSLSLDAWDVLFEGAPARLFGVPDPFGHLRPDPACPEAVAESLRVVPFIRREDLEPLALSTPLARADAAGIQQWKDLGPLVAVRRRGARRPWHALCVRGAVDEDACANRVTTDSVG